MASEEVQVSSQNDLPNVAFPIMEEMRRKGELCDVVIKVNEKSFSAHRVVLAATIPFYRAMFTSDTLESRLHEIKVNGVEPIAMEALINFAYSGKITVNTSNVHCLFLGASYWQLGYVKDACVEFLKQRIQPKNVFSLRSLGDTFGCCALTKAADTYMRKNFSEVSVKKEFLELNVNHVQDLISDEEFHVESESFVFEAVIRWVKTDVYSRAQHLPLLFARVGMHLLSPQFLVDCVATEELIRSSPKCRDLLDDYLLPERRPLLQSFRGRHRCCIEVVNLIWAFKTMVNSKFEFDDNTGFAVMRDKLYVIGGTKLLASAMCAQNTVKVFDVKLKVWTEAAPLNFGRYHVGTAVLNDQHLFVIGGGDDSNGRMNTVEKYDAIHNCWSLVGSMATNRCDAGAVGFEGCVYALGGLPGRYTVLNSVEKYDPRTDQWTSFTPMQSKRCRMGVAVLGGKIYVCGGCDEDRSLSSVEVLDPVTKEWIYVCPMNVPRSGLDLVAGRGKLFAIGGYEVDLFQNTWKSTVEIYDPETDTWTLAPPMNADLGEVGMGLLSLYEP